MPPADPGDSTAPGPAAAEPTAAEASPWSEGDAYLDLRGEVCPFTFVRTKLLLEELPMGACLRVLVDHPPAARNVPRSALAWGQRVLAIHALDGAWHIDLQKRRD